MRTPSAARWTAAQLRARCPACGRRSARWGCRTRCASSTRPPKVHDERHGRALSTPSHAGPAAVFSLSPRVPPAAVFRDRSIAPRKTMGEPFVWFPSLLGALLLGREPAYIRRRCSRAAAPPAGPHREDDGGAGRRHTALAVAGRRQPAPGLQKGKQLRRAFRHSPQVGPLRGTQGAPLTRFKPTLTPAAPSTTLKPSRVVPGRALACQPVLPRGCAAGSQGHRLLAPQP